MLYPKFRGRPVLATQAAYKELERFGMELADAVEVLEDGFPCERSQRKRGILERCVKLDRKTLKVVAAESYNHMLEIECWVITHVGMFR